MQDSVRLVVMSGLVKYKKCPGNRQMFGRKGI